MATSTPSKRNAVIIADTATISGNITTSGNVVFDDGQITSNGTALILDGAGGKEVEIKSARDIRLIIDDNDDDTGNRFEIYKHSVTSANELLVMDQSANMTVSNNITVNGSFVTSTASSALGIYAGATQVFEGSTRNLKNINTINCSEITTSGTVKIGTTAATGWPINGARINDVGSALFSREGSSALLLNRGTTTRGDILQFYSDEVKCGQIGYTVPYGGNFYITMGSTSGFGLAFYNFSSAFNVNPVNMDGTNKDNLVDLGSSSARFNDIYATNGTIQTSDRNEKQDIQALTDAETRVATACKGLIKRFRWIDSVEEKGDSARYHFGAIAQDVENAFIAEGLDASKYGLFIRNNWWEYEGHSYLTAEEAPTGAVEKTRLGIRYNELFAFIISAL